MTRRSISLYRRIENALETIALGSTPLDTIKSAAHFLVGSFAQDLGISGGRIYVQENGSYEIVSTFGDIDKSPIGQTVQRSYPPFDQLSEVGSAVMRRDDERLDARIEAELGTREWFAAVAVADGAYVLSFDFEADGGSNEELRSTLNIIRLAINQKLREERMIEILEDARCIQNSILPRRLPRIRNFQIAARTVPAEIVGGDFYDVITPGEAAFNVVVADATGHGLPAALQVRDVFTGLRMGLSRDFKLTRTLERLNSIIHRSRLSTKFVSLFLAEVEHGGTVLYSNAGHPPALMIRASGEVERLRAGGMILGPMPNATYGIGLVCMGPGDLLAMYTDGITEATPQAGGDEFGEDSLTELLVRHRRRQPSAIIESVFSKVKRYSGTSSPEDDQTVVIVKRRQVE